MRTGSLPWDCLALPDAIRQVLETAPSVACAGSIEDLSDLACGGRDHREWMVRYVLPDGREVVEATVVRVKNGIAANYPEPYMRRRDPDCMVIGDERPSDKPRFADRYGEPFTRLRRETLDWLAAQDLAVFALEIGQPGTGGDALAICPANAGFFAFGLGLLQGVVDLRAIDRTFKPSTIILVAPPFRHTHFDG
ncbi:MAG: DUF4914 family protein, partial [Pirellulales bacterium]|nr:DUF4914 family protein [Pirellulales bacterium]